ncbi:class I SAM-dependent rRNA methyltransferase [Pseudomonas chengduensis]|jgi:23S rRNA (cytosine1962-C5)-methyltransferase|uniref:23S rRNA (Cytosine1962-C5)-methyltransferase n=1 Tax=Ectopseudomonas chengduensis TaxID=489632 RepID=A0A1G6TCH6_9GAMM|nr:MULTISPECIES: class I SAM-dependent rRNA methyltransferase [Pseudomonas]KJU79353.1 SAM-dependent methyltransferase [Pseudomonas oleovorans]MBP3062579.1 methyltransferase domain-containing protein [Pseudomonas chengduensis]MDH0625062.1 class I SAM-dependent rRNA methyltransferase [Pseudomonas chengduensis]MDH1213343.1 class I SAM-dependent rRNA methyltransferase [Pseudomonas chengduensis]MDH1623125.1 class I SAM-dependent rRNA methyltransferase [Pseudomonas chengduensis]
MSSLPSLRLKANADRRLRAGHLWVYSNEIDVAATPLHGFAAGDQAVLEAAGGKPLGIVAMSPNNLICARLLSRDVKHVLDKSLLVHRLNVCLSLRERLFDKPCYRLVYGDSDLLPGLVVDRFFDILVVQLASATMEAHKDDVLAALIQVCKPSGILFKNDSSARDAEGLERYVATAYGEVPEWVALEENGVKFEAPVIEGQKTGWFYDHRMNRARLAPYVKGKRVLDLFSYIGGWGVQAAAFGASEVFCVDASAFALDGVERNATLNGFAEKVTCVEGDVFAALRELKSAEERFDVVIADPPAFIKRKKDIKNGEAAYRRLNETAMRLLNKDGILVSASCSMHLEEDNLQNILLTSARHLDRNIQLLERGAQGPDHPVHPAINETRYIKSLTMRLLPNS